MVLSYFTLDSFSEIMSSVTINAGPFLNSHWLRDKLRFGGFRNTTIISGVTLYKKTAVIV